MKNGAKFALSLGLPLLVGFSASLFTRPQIDSWYRTLDKPDWQPPNWVFGPTWTLLYLMMGIALFIVWKKEAPAANKRRALTFFFIQLALNFLWSLLFFDQHRLDLALYEILLLWVMILATLFAFGRISAAAAWLLVPYISWVSFAALLTWSIYRLNPGMT